MSHRYILSKIAKDMLMMLIFLGLEIGVHEGLIFIFI